MKPLIEITMVPIQIEMKTTNAKLEYARGTAEMEITRDNGSCQNGVFPPGHAKAPLHRLACFHAAFYFWA